MITMPRTGENNFIIAIKNESPPTTMRKSLSSEFELIPNIRENKLPPLLPESAPIAGLSSSESSGAVASFSVSCAEKSI